FFAQPASSFTEMFTGLGAFRIRKLFEAARKQAPAIVFIDELDAVGSTRSGSVLSREQDQTLNQLLVELDGFREQSGVVVMASTNRLDTLDPALLRPGRFDRHVLVGPPDLRGRAEILQVHTRQKPLAGDVSLDELARVTAGLTGADLEGLCNEAAIRAGRAGRREVTARDFDDAFDRVVAGLRTRRLISGREKRLIAYHEAGHALAAHAVGDGVTHRVSIVPAGEALGYTMRLPEEDRVLATRDDLEAQLVVLLGGRAAEEEVFGQL